MISKLHTGKRIAMHRRRLSLSQTELSVRLGVTSQAVSKWECGASLPDVELLLELSHIFGVTVNELIEDSDLIASLTGRECGREGIACFVCERETSNEWEREIIRGNWIERNWREAEAADDIRSEVGRRISSHGGIILEIGAGPGGGYMPYILHSDPDAAVIISDLSPVVVGGWKVLLDRELGSPNIHYAVFNFCDMPFRDACIDVISDGGGIGNCEHGTRKQALREAYRVLKPGGMLVTSTGFVTNETLAALPEEAQSILTRERPDIFHDLYEETVLAGFSEINSVISGEWYTDDDESAIAELARSLGVNLKFTAYIRYCRKR